MSNEGLSYHFDYQGLNLELVVDPSTIDPKYGFASGEVLLPDGVQVDGFAFITALIAWYCNRSVGDSEYRISSGSYKNSGKKRIEVNLRENKKA